MKISQRWSKDPEPLPGAGFGRGYDPPASGWGNPISYEEIIKFVEGLEKEIVSFIKKHAETKEDYKKMLGGIWDELDKLVNPKLKN